MLAFNQVSRLAPFRPSAKLATSKLDQKCAIGDPFTICHELDVMEWTFLDQFNLDLVTRVFLVSFAISEKVVQIQAEMAILSTF